MLMSFARFFPTFLGTSLEHITLKKSYLLYTRTIAKSHYLPPISASDFLSFPAE